MSTLTKIVVTLTLSLMSLLSFGQAYTARVIDAKTNQPIPFATVITGEYSGTITNEEGVFSVELRKIQHPQDSVFISSMGYDKIGVVATDRQEVVSLSRTPFELKQVYLSNENLSPEEIIERVKTNLDANYAVGLTKKKIFLRKSDNDRVQKFDIEFKESTIPELNEELIDSIALLIPREDPYYQETVGDLYGGYNGYKLYLDKAAELYDKNKDVSLDALGDKLENIFKENVKPDSYLKIKSGIFGTKMQLDSLQQADSVSDDSGTITVSTEDE